jgi:hypothetical protein
MTAELSIGIGPLTIPIWLILTLTVANFIALIYTYYSKTEIKNKFWEKVIFIHGPCFLIFSLIISILRV